MHSGMWKGIRVGRKHELLVLGKDLNTTEKLVVNILRNSARGCSKCLGHKSEDLSSIPHDPFKMLGRVTHACYPSAGRKRQASLW